MEIEEHFYSDDPKIGPPDVRTTLADTDYYFLGNGYITPVIQVCASGEGTPIGLLIMDPQTFGPKRAALTLSPKDGLHGTMLEVSIEGNSILPQPSGVIARWCSWEHLPCVEATWGDEKINIRERFFCPDRKTPVVSREIRIDNRTKKALELDARTRLLEQTLKKSIQLAPGQAQNLLLQYRLVHEKETAAVRFEWLAEVTPDAEAQAYWQRPARFHSDSPQLNHFFDAATKQIPANVAANGKMDASIWQYNLEWVRDQSMVVLGLVLSGHFKTAHSMLDRMLTYFVTDKGDTVDSGQTRELAEVELDQNGELLLALETYVNWTGDLELARRYWPKIQALANFPLQDAFRHPETFLLHNQREYWERHSLYGIEDGMEMIYQYYVALGLQSAANLARLLGHEEETSAWQQARLQIEKAMLHDPTYALVENGHLIKRRKVNGEIQREVTMAPEIAAKLPDSIPMLQPGPHLLDPDTSTALPIVWGGIAPHSDLAQNTMQEIEKLWNQNWQGGGYGRYNYTSEPDSSGAWPFPSLFVARAYFEMGQDHKVWRVLNWLAQAQGGRAGSWFEFYGERPIPPCPQIGIVPWVWAEMLMFFVHHLLGVRPGWNSVHIRPRLLRGIQRVEADLRLRDQRLVITIDDAGRQVEFNGKRYPCPPEGIVVDF